MSSTGTELRARTRRLAPALAFVIPTLFLGVSLRLWAVHNWAPPCQTTSAAGAEVCVLPTGDAVRIAELSSALGRGRGFVDPRDVTASSGGAMVPPVLPTVLALGERLGFAAFGSMRSWAALVGAAGAVSVGVFAWLLDARRRALAGVVPAIVAASSPFWIEDDALLRPNLVLVPIVAALLWLLLRARGPGRGIGIGLLLGAAILTRSDSMALAVIVLTVMAVRHAREPASTGRRFGGPPLVAGAATLGMVLPWVLYNQLRGVGFAVSERGWGDVEPLLPDLVGEWRTLDSPGFVVEGLLIIILVVGVTRRHRLGLTWWPFAAVAASSVVVGVSQGFSGSVRLPIDVGAVVLSGELAIAAWAWLSGRWASEWSTKAAPALRRWRAVPPIASKLGALFLVALCAWAVRFSVVTVQRPPCGEPKDATVADVCYWIGGDAIYYHDQAQNLVLGKGFMSHGIVSAQHPPLFPLLLAGFESAGLRTPQDQRQALCVVGGIGAALIALVGYRLGALSGLPPMRVGAWAGAIAVVNPAFWLSEATLLSESLLLPLLALAFLASVELVRKPGWWTAAAFGAGIGAATMTRAELLVATVPIGLLVLFRRPWREGLARRAGQLALAAAVVIGSILPWYLYNQGRFENRVILTTTPGLTLSYTACDEVFYGDLIGYFSLTCGQLNGLPVDESVADAIRVERAMSYYGENASRVPVQMLASVARTLEVWRPAEDATIAAVFEGRGLASSFAATFGFLMLAPLVVGGVRHLRRSSVSLMPCGAFALAVAAAVAFGGGVVRYRLPVDLVAALLAAIGATRLSAVQADAPLLPDPVGKPAVH